MDVCIEINGRQFGGRVDRLTVFYDPKRWVRETVDAIEYALLPRPKRLTAGTNRHLQKCGPQAFVGCYAGGCERLLGAG